MEITPLQLRSRLLNRYPNAHIEIFDSAYDVWKPGSAATVYNQFILQMRLVGLTLWLRNKLDCDKWAWLLRAYVIVRNALSANEHARAIGLICYCIDGDKRKPHAVNAIAVQDGEGFQIVELEPQPKGGLYNLSEKEKATVWFAQF